MLLQTLGAASALIKQPNVYIVMPAQCCPSTRLNNYQIICPWTQTNSSSAEQSDHACGAEERCPRMFVHSRIYKS